MLKTRLFCTLICVLMLLSCAAFAEETPVAPELVAGKIMAYVINSDGAKVYKDIFLPDATHDTEDTLEYGTEVEIQTLGLGYCRLRDAEKRLLYVRTSDLSFSNEAFENQLAIVFVKRSNKLPLHKTDSAKSRRVTDVPDGSYVVVLEKGDTFSHVLYGKYDGYLQNAYLSFRVSWQEEVRQAVLRDPNKPKRKTTVNLRSADSANGKKVAVVPTWNKTTKANTILSVLQFRGDWAEVETEKGIHGYLKADWVEIVEPAAEAPAEEKTGEQPEEKAEESEAAPAVEDEELKEGTAMAETEALVDDEEEPLAAEDEDLSPEWEE